MDMDEDVANNAEDSAGAEADVSAEDTDAEPAPSAAQPNEENEVQNERSSDDNDEEILRHIWMSGSTTRSETDSSDGSSSFNSEDDDDDDSSSMPSPEPRPQRRSNEPRYREIRFDTSLPAEHSYLGDNMNRVSGVEYLEAGRVHRLMLFLHQHIVYPGEVMPLMIPGLTIDGHIDASNGLLFGVAFAHVRCSKTQAMYGVTCQVYEKGTDDRGNTLIKSRALQRFITENETRREHLEYITSGPQLKTFGHVKILPEIYLPEPLSTINVGSMNRFRDLPRFERYLKAFQVATTVWPAFVYSQYNTHTIIEKVLKSLEAHKVQSMPSDPIRLSFWLSRNAHFSEEELKRIFITDSVNLRMRLIADSFLDGGVFVCRFCRNQIAYCRELFAMSKQGVQSQYCNSAGYIHETNTVYKVFKNSIAFTGEPSCEFSWFPGYEWLIIVCKMCNRHIGWRFRAITPSLTPSLFYGITGASVKIDKENKRRSLRDQLVAGNLRAFVDL